MTKADVGDRIRILNSVDRRYENGDEFLVVKADQDGAYIDSSKYGNVYVFDEEYEVISDSSPLKVEIDYEKIAQEVAELVWQKFVEKKEDETVYEVGDFVEVTNKRGGVFDTMRDMTIGNVYEIKRIVGMEEDDKDYLVIDDVGDEASIEVDCVKPTTRKHNFEKGDIVRVKGDYRPFHYLVKDSIAEVVDSGELSKLFVKGVNYSSSGEAEVNPQYIKYSDVELIAKASDRRDLDE